MTESIYKTILRIKIHQSDRISVIVLIAVVVVLILTFIKIFFKERIIPKAILYFTGEVVDDEMYDDEYDEEEEEDDDDEDDDDDDGDDDDDEDDPKFKSNKNQSNKAKALTGNQKPPSQLGTDPKANPPECKQS
jgi:hypothetical protein